MTETESFPVFRYLLSGIVLGVLGFVALTRSYPSPRDSSISSKGTPLQNTLEESVPYHTRVDQNIMTLLQQATDRERVFWRDPHPAPSSNYNTTMALSELQRHSSDASYHPPTEPDAVVYPRNTDEVSAVLRVCHQHRIPVTPCGTRTGLEGGSIPYGGGVSLDMTHMARVLRLQETELTVTVEAGITKTQLNGNLSEHGLFFPVDPGSDSSIGGQASTGASGTLSVKYGTFKENVVSLRVVLADGQILDTRRAVRKSSTGFDFTQLMLGSEGTLGIITELTLKVNPQPTAVSAAVATFPDVSQAAQTVVRLRRGGVQGLARCELLNSVAIKAVNNLFNTTHEEKPTLFLEFHGATEDAVLADARHAEEMSRDNGGMGFQTAVDEKDRDELWRGRRSAYYASLRMRSVPGKKLRLFVTDVCVPLSALAPIISETEAEFVDKPIPCSVVGHVADGNFHLMIPFDPTNPDEHQLIQNVNDNLIDRALKYGGTCSGEHGVGVGKKRCAASEHGQVFLDAMRAVKFALDPRMILNPHKLVTLDPKLPVDYHFPSKKNN
eukprot:gb/GECH01012350.1/.p1 GENE.gb/GECH01012350.1/~~gb/GECH01012350.1/.p1  ORF type:complete len:554 (+),score=120.61 gb/GECH01012350.1/:1-1662(+)